MFKVDDYVMYGTTGLCKVVDITNEKFLNTEREYYVLSPIYVENTIIKTPVDNRKVQMRSIISKDNLDFIISEIPKQETLWINDEKTRKEDFKSMLKTSDCEDLVKIIRTINHNKQQTKPTGKNPYQSDIDIMKEAERLLNEEFAFILNISPKEVTSYIANNMPQ